MRKYHHIGIPTDIKQAGEARRCSLGPTVTDSAEHPSEGVVVAFVLVDGAPVELLQFLK